MTSTASVTVIVPCYNVAATLNRAVTSVLSQTVRPTTLLLIDDASTDDTAEVLRDLEMGHPEWIRCISLVANRGPSYARNVGWDAAVTDFVAFLDADDEWHPRKLEIQLKWFRENLDAQMSGHQCIQYSGNTIEIETESWEVRSFTLRDMLTSNRFSTPSVMVRRSVRHRFPVSRRHAEDYQLWLRLAADMGHLERIELPLAWYFKPPYGAYGLSAQLWAMEIGELAALRDLRDCGRLGGLAWAGFSTFSLVKFTQRFACSSMARLFAK